MRSLAFIAGIVVLTGVLVASVSAGTAGRIVGSAKNDVLKGTPHADSLDGKAGNDTLYGYAGNDVLVGGRGNDKLVGGPGHDKLRCGAGKDTAIADATDTVAADCELVKGLTTTPPAEPPQSQQELSVYLSLPSDRVVRDRTVLLTSSFVLKRDDSLLVEADGTFAPEAPQGAASIYVTVDGKRVTNDSAIDWRGSEIPVRHSFNAVGAAQLPGGSHTVELVAEPRAGGFSVSSSSNLAIFVHPASTVSIATLNAEAGPFDFTTRGQSGPDVPHQAVLSVNADARGPTIALASGSTHVASRWGDAMLGIFLDGRHPGIASSLWTVNDMCACAELEAPLFTQALLQGGTKQSTVSFDATEFPWMGEEDSAVYGLDSSATLVVLNGGMRAVGKASSVNDGTAWDYVCLATSVNWPGCPKVGSDVLLAEETFTVGAKRPGVMMFAAKTRVQADSADAGGIVRVWLTADGIQRGSIGIQQLAAPSSVSQRTIAASYLAAGSLALKRGHHVIRVYARADGSYLHVSLLRDIPLVWFD